MKKTLTFLLTCGMIALMPAATNADVLYSQPLASQGTIGFGWNSEGPVGAVSNQQIANRFTTAAPGGVVSSVSWWGLYHGDATPSPPTAFLVRFFGDSGGSPAGLLTSDPVSVTGVDTGLNNVSGFSIYAYTASFAGPSLSGSTTYHLSILENALTPNAIWTWAFADSGDTAFSRNGEAGSWSGVFRGNAYIINGSSIPEPTTAGLIGLGVIGLGLVRRRK